MKILVLWRVKENADFSVINDLIIDEEVFAWKDYLAGNLREHYESDMPVPAISIVEADSIEDAKKHYSELPINKAGLLEPEYYPLRPFKNWEVLFKDEHKTAS